MMSLQRKNLVLSILLVVLAFPAVNVFVRVRDGMRGYFDVSTYTIAGSREGRFVKWMYHDRYVIFPAEKIGMMYANGLDADPWPLKDCRIQDRCHWTCSEGNGQDIVMVGCRRMPAEGRRDVSALEWWLSSLIFRKPTKFLL